MSSRSLLGLLVAVGAIGACRPDRSADAAAADSATVAAAPTIASYTFTATDYAFSGPVQIPAGTVALRMANKGKETHHFVLVRLEQEKTYADLDSVLKLPGMPPEWVRMVGGSAGSSQPW